MEDTKYNGFNNGINASDGVGGKKPPKAKILIHSKKPITVAAIDTLRTVCKSSKLPFTIRYNHWDNTFMVKVMGKHFQRVNIDEALTEAIKFVSIANGYVTEKQWKKVNE